MVHAWIVFACTIVPPLTAPHVLDPAEAADSAAPTITSVTATVHRNEPEGCREPEGSLCEGMASLGLAIEASDDRTPIEKLGYLVSIVPGGDPPDSVSLSESPGEPVDHPDRGFYYPISYDDEDYDFEIEVRVVDLNGNVSEPKRVHIESTSGLGCSTTRSEWSLLPTLAFLLRRRRRR